MDAIEYYAHHLAYGFIILMCALPLIGALTLVARFFPPGPVEVIANLVGLVLICAYLLGGTRLVNTASRKRVFEGEGFFEALGSAWGEACLYLAYAPLVGRLLRGGRSDIESGGRPGAIHPK